MIDRFSGAYRFLSNFYPVDVTWNGITFPSVEHAFQAAKTDDKEEQRRISRLATAGDAKRAGRKLRLRSQWEEARKLVMLELLKQKFDREKNPDLYRLLKNTGKEELVEGNTWGDTFWGVCDGVGQNWLGKLLMKVRDL